MDEDQLADDLLQRAVRDEQAVWPIQGTADVERVRTLVRQRARAVGVKIRTAVIDDEVLAVVRLDAALWDAPTATMRTALGLPPT